MRPQLKKFQIRTDYGFRGYGKALFRNFFIGGQMRQAHEAGMANSMQALLNGGKMYKENFNYGTGLGDGFEILTNADIHQYVFAITQITVSIDDHNGPSIFKQNLVRANEPPHEFFFAEDMNSNGSLKAHLLQRVLEAFIKTLDDGDNIYNNKTGFCSMIITAYPFETLEDNLIDSGKHPNVEVIFVNGTRGSLSVAYGSEFEKSISLASQFLEAVPDPATKQLIFVMHSGLTFGLPQDDLSILLGTDGGAVTAAAAASSHSRTLQSVVDGRTHSLSLTESSPGDRASKFGAGPVFLDSGKKALTGAISRQRRRNNDTIFALDPGGHSLILLMSQGRRSVGTLAHELAHCLGDIQIYRNKFLSNPNTGLTRKAIRDLQGYQEWCGFRPPEIPQFDSAHTRPALRIDGSAELGCSVVLSMAAVGAGNNKICPVDVTDVLSYSGHPLMMLGFQSQRMQTLGASGGETRCITGTLFEFYMFAGAVLLMATQTDGLAVEEAEIFITTSLNYAANLDRVAKNTPSYVFCELLNYGEDDLATSFKPGAAGAATIATQSLNNFITARKESYELEYSDSAIGGVDILKINNSHKTNSKFEQNDSSQETGKHTLYNHVSSTVLESIGFESLGESDEIIEVFNGEPVKTRSGASLTQDNKFHRLVISKARGDSVNDLKTKHEPNAHPQETEMLTAIYNGTAIAHELAFPKEDGSGGEEMKHVYLIVKDKVNLDVSSADIFDNVGRRMLL